MALSQRLLLATLRLERKISDTLAARMVPCLKRLDGQCLVVSPLMFWGHDESTLMSDANVLHTLAPSNNVSVAGVPVESEMVVAWDDRSKYSSIDAGSTVFLALTYFFPERDCLGKTGHVSWLNILEDASKDSATLITETQQPKLIAFEVCRAILHHELPSLVFTVHNTQIFLCRFIRANCVYLPRILSVRHYLQPVYAKRASSA